MSFVLLNESLILYHLSDALFFFPCITAPLLGFRYLDYTSPLHTGPEFAPSLPLWRHALKDYIRPGIWDVVEHRGPPCFGIWPFCLVLAFHLRV